MFGWVLTLFWVVATAEVVFNADTVIVSSSQDQQVPAFRLALRDVSQDWYGTFGRTAIFSDSIPAAATFKHSASKVVIFLGSTEGLRSSFPSLASQIPTLKNEQHVCKMLKFNSSGQFFPLVCVGQGTLGTSYALYSFSELVLGVHPQEFWIEKKPILRSQITLNEDFQFDSGVAVWQNRGFFINDEDQLGGWTMDPLGEKVFTLQMWDQVFQTTLRLKGNTIIVGTSAFPDEESFDLAVRRGLSLSQHHVTPLGTAMFAWPNGLPYDFPYNPEIPMEAWKRNAQFAKDQGRNVVWTVGYRGKNDYPFWYDVPSFNTSESRGKLIGDAIRTQKKIIEDIFGKDQIMVSYLWSELLPLYAGGYLKFPEGVHVVHADNGAGQIFHEELISEGHGVYYHVAMMSNHQNQLTELNMPSRLITQLSKFVKKNATSYYLINTSDLRAVPLTTKMAMEFAWDPYRFMNVSPAQAQDEFIKRWVARSYEIDERSSTCREITNIYNRYFSVPYMAGTSGSSVPLGEHHLNTANREISTGLISHLVQRSPLPVKEATAQIKLIESSIAILNKLGSDAHTISPKIHPSRASFYNAHILTQIEIHYRAAKSLVSTSKAVLYVAKNDFSAAESSLKDALKDIDFLLAKEKTAEEGRWKNWFQWDQIVDFFSLRDDINRAILAVGGERKAENFPSSRTYFSGTGPWSQEFQYYNYHQTYFPMFYKSNFFMDTAVTVECAANVSKSCSLTPIGVDFSGSTSYVVLGVPRPGAQIRYTLSEDEPNSQSQLWTGNPIQITKSWVSTNGRLAAAVFQGSQKVGPVTRAVITTK